MVEECLKMQVAELIYVFTFLKYSNLTDFSNMQIFLSEKKLKTILLKLLVMLSITMSGLNSFVASTQPILFCKKLKSCGAGGFD